MVFLLLQLSVVVQLVDVQPAPVPDIAVPAAQECAELRETLQASERLKTDRVPVIEEQIRQLNEQIEKSGETEQATQQKEALIQQRTSLQTDAKSIETIVTAHRAAVDACERAARFRRELEQLSDADIELEPLAGGEIAAMQSQLEQVQAARVALLNTQQMNDKLLNDLLERTKNVAEDAPAGSLLERQALQAEQSSILENIKSCDAQQALLAQRIKASQQAGTATPPEKAAVPSATQEETEALNKQRLAELLDAEARDRLGYAQQHLTDLQSQKDELEPASPQRQDLELEIEYWQRVAGYEQRRIKQAELGHRAAQAKKAISQLKNRRQEVLGTQAQLQEERASLAPEQRQEQSGVYLELQQEALRRDAELLKKAENAGQEAEPLQKILPNLDAVEEAVKERVLAAEDAALRQRLENHYRRLLGQLDAERQQIDSMIMTTENIAYAIARQGDLQTQLAGAFLGCAEILVPSVVSFWERHRRLVTSAKIIGLALAASYGLKMIIWLIERVLLSVQRVVRSARMSLKRLGTLLRFFGSIIKLFVWIFSVIAVLNEFGIDPKQSSGAIGLIGLILAGMFQQIVVDFVKGLDIVIGQHYHVGDFVEVDGKFGHVVNFDVKHTRIRTPSGQEFNLPNSRCIPSRKFPDGYVTNLVDILFHSLEDAERAKPIIQTVGRDVNQRIEAMRDQPGFDRYFREVQGRIIARYRIRVLPGCPWVITDYFLPEVQKALSEEGIELAAEPSHTFINRVETFRKLFSRQLTEEEIIREAKDTALPLVQ